MCLYRVRETTPRLLINKEKCGQQVEQNCCATRTVQILASCSLFPFLMNNSLSLALFWFAFLGGFLFNVNGND